MKVSKHEIIEHYMISLGQHLHFDEKYIDLFNKSMRELVFNKVKFTSFLVRLHSEWKREAKYMREYFKEK